MKEWYIEYYETKSVKATHPGHKSASIDDAIRRVEAGIAAGHTVRVLAPAGASTEEIDKLKALGATLA